MILLPTSQNYGTGPRHIPTPEEAKEAREAAVNATLLPPKGNYLRSNALLSWRQRWHFTWACGESD